MHLDAASSKRIRLLKSRPSRASTSVVRKFCAQACAVASRLARPLSSAQAQLGAAVPTLTHMECSADPNGAQEQANRTILVRPFSGGVPRTPWAAFTDAIEHAPHLTFACTCTEANKQASLWSEQLATWIDGWTQCRGGRSAGSVHSVILSNCVCTDSVDRTLLRECAFVKRAKCDVFADTCETRCRIFQCAQCVIESESASENKSAWCLLSALAGGSGESALLPSKRASLVTERAGWMSGALLRRIFLRRNDNCKTCCHVGQVLCCGSLTCARLCRSHPRT